MTDVLRIAARPDRAVLRVAGPDWRSFLQGLLTQDVDRLQAGEARFAALLTPQGRLLHDLFVVGEGEGALLDVDAGNIAALAQRLALYRLRAKVEIAPAELTVLAAVGPRPADAPGLTVTGDPRLAALGWRLYGPAPAAAAFDYDAHRLVLGVPGTADWGTERTYPIEANFDLLNGIDFKKGCFVGQETTSRMKRRGQVKSRMLPLVFEGAAPPAGTEVLAGELRAGETLSGAEGRAMALVRLDRALGRPLTVDGRPARAEVPTWMAPHLGETSA